MKADELRCPTCRGYHPQGAFAFSVLVERLIEDGFVRDDRSKELLERARNLRAGRGFLPDAAKPRRNPTEEEELFS